MSTLVGITKTFFDAVKADDLSTARQLLANNPELCKARWPGRSGDGKMRSLGPSPFNQHTWLTVPETYQSDDPRFTSTPLIYTRNDEMVRLLIESGADVNAKGTSGDIETPNWFYIPLWRAAHDGRLASVSLLVEHGADPNYPRPDGGNQALYAAAENNRTETSQYLLAHGAIPDLITAAMLGLPERVQALLAAQPELIRHRDCHGRSALDAATLCDTFHPPTSFHPGHDQCAEILLQHGAPLELSHAASLGRLDDIKQMVEKDPQILRHPVEITALLGGAASKESPLQAAKRRSRAEVINYLLQHGAIDQPQIIWR